MDQFGKTTRAAQAAKAPLIHYGPARQLMRNYCSPPPRGAPGEAQPLWAGTGRRPPGTDPVINTPRRAKSRRCPSLKCGTKAAKWTAGTAGPLFRTLVGQKGLFFPLLECKVPARRHRPRLRIYSFYRFIWVHCEIDETRSTPRDALPTHQQLEIQRQENVFFLGGGGGQLNLLKYSF